MDRLKQVARARSVRVSFAEFQYIIRDLDLQTHKHMLKGAASIEYYVGNNIVAAEHHSGLSPEADNYFVYLVYEELKGTGLPSIQGNEH